MAKSFSLEIITPEKLFYSGDAEIVTVQTLSGEEGFMANHVWACKLLGVGELWFRETGSKEMRLAAISGGFIDVHGNILVFTDSAEWPDEIDVERAALSGEREKQWLADNAAAAPEEAEIHKVAARRAEIRQLVAAGGRKR